MPEDCRIPGHRCPKCLPRHRAIAEQPWEASRSRSALGRMPAAAGRFASSPSVAGRGCADFSALPTFAGAPSAGSAAPTGLQGLSPESVNRTSRGRNQCSDAVRLEPSAAIVVWPDRSGGGSRPLDVPAIREDFPILRQRVHGKPLAWLDNAATTQKPQSVIDAISHFYQHDNSNIHRAAHTLAARATDAYEGGPAKGANLSRRLVGQGNRLRPRHDRGDQSRHPNLWAKIPAAGRRSRPVHARTSCQHRSLANGGQGKGSRPAGHSRSTTAAKSCSRNIKKFSAPAPRSSR